MNTPTIPSTTMKLARVMPCCWRLMTLSPRVFTRTISPDWRADARGIERTRANPAFAVQPDQEGLAAQVGLRQEAPVSAVLAVVAIVAHHEIVAGRDRPLAVAVGADQIATRQHV